MGSLVNAHQSLLVAILVSLLGGSASAVKLAPNDLAYFESKIRPVLAKHCYECHSKGSRELGGKLYLDSRDGILQGGESGPALVAGRPEESLLIQAVRREDPDLEMPPEHPLPEAIVHELVEWVKRGAPDPREGGLPQSESLGKDALWSFQPMSRPTLPESNREWPRDAIDHFILARLEQAGHQPVQDASPEVLARRLYVDLVGLAPTRAELDAFDQACASDRPSAVAQLVDRLLASPQFGERWGRHWLDVARYGESNGNDGLGRNPSFPHAWRYRDYVIDAFNNDTPYDRFLKEQIAGDLLPTATKQEHYRNLIATGFLAIGFKPAAAMNQNFAMDVVDDQINVVSTGVMGLSVACARCHDHKHDPIPTRDYYALAGIFRSTETLYGRAANEGLTAPPTPLHALFDGEKKEAVVQFAKDYGKAIDSLKPALHARLDGPVEGLHVEKGTTLSKDFAKVDTGRLRVEKQLPANRYSVSFWFRNDLSTTARAITTYFLSHGADGDTTQHGDNVGIGGTHEAGRSGKLFLWTGMKNDQSLRGTKVLAPGSWNHVVLVRNDKKVRLYLNGDPKPELEGEMEVADGENRRLFIGARMDGFAPLQGYLAELAVFDRALTPAEAQTLHEKSGQKAGTRQEAWAMGVRDKKAIGDCKINIDGNSRKLGAAVPRGFLSACKSEFAPPTIGTTSSGRLQLVDWLTRGDHPQTARVMVNRVWLHLFGRGLVITPDDFGVYGARPSHPALLDHLARRFVRDGWSVKKLIRNIVLSRTYQLDSRCEDQELLDADPENVLLARHSRRRLDAESIRDRVLQASGQLKLERPEGSAIDEVVALINWPPGEAKYLHEPSVHRSVYLCMLRNSPPPELAPFDFPDGLSVHGRRPVTTSPSHGLFFMNNSVVVEQARALSEFVLKEREIAEDRIALAYLRVFQREPSSPERERALAYLRAMEAELSGADATAQAWASFCQSLMASSEFRYVD